MACLGAAFVVTPAAAEKTLQDFETGAIVEEFSLENGVGVEVTVHNHGGGPDIAIVFDSEEPTGGDWDLGAPNSDFGGPGLGAGGGEGKEGANTEKLGNVLIIAEDDDDSDGDGLVDDPDDESGGGVVWLSFSHAGRLSVTIVDVDEDEDEPRIVLYAKGERVGEIVGENVGDNGAQTLDCSEEEDVDLAEIHLDGSASIANIQLEVPVVGVEPGSWTTVKRQYR
jgi:hypothetical protein